MPPATSASTVTVPPLTVPATVRQEATPSTTVTDSFYHRRQPNQYGVEASSAIISLAKKYNAAVWDQFTLMGGLGSVEKWAQSGLATWDLVHFTSEGYTVFGNLLFNAMMDRYSEVCR